MGRTGEERSWVMWMMEEFLPFFLSFSSFPSSSVAFSPPKDMKPGGNGNFTSNYQVENKERTKKEIKKITTKAVIKPQKGSCGVN